MDKQEFKDRLANLGTRYEAKIQELKDLGFKKFVEWEIVRKLRVYLYGKNLNIDTHVLEYGNFYSCVIVEDYIINENGERGDTVAVIVITPEDTEGSAYGKADRLILKEHTEYLKEKGEIRNG